jgi:cephalosporin hydroxylase
MGLRSRLSQFLQQDNKAAVDPVETPLPNNPTRNPQCSEFEIDGWNISEFIVHRLVPIVGTHPFPLHELMLMCAAITRLEPSVIFEWGTNIGKSARIFHETACYYGIKTTIHSIDLPDDIEHGEHPHSQRGELVRGIDDVRLHQGDGLNVALKLWEDAGSPSGPMFFIDGDHSYESVKRELEGITKAVRDPILLLHDTFYQSPESGYNIGPHRAISELLAEHPGRFSIVETSISLPGMSLLIPAKAPS